MAPIDREILLGFVEEVRGYLPRIRRGIETAGEAAGEAERSESLEEAHRLSHSIKGAASMVGLGVLARVAEGMEDAIERAGAGQLDLDRAALGAFGGSCEQIDLYLDGLIGGEPPEQDLLRRTASLFRSLHGEQEPEDEAELDRVLAECSDTQLLPAAPEARSEPVSRPGVEELTAELVDSFREEAEELFETIHGRLRQLARRPEDRELIAGVERGVHTLKGAAGMVGLPALSALAHRFEDILERLRETSLPPRPEIFELLFASAEAMHDLALGREGGELEAVLEELERSYDELLRAGAPEVAAEGGREEPGTDLARNPDPHAPAVPTAGGPTSGDASPLGSQMVRMPIERLDELVRLVSELMVNRSNFEQYLGRHSRQSEELARSVERLRGISRRLETEYEVLALAGEPAAPEASGAPSPAVTAPALAAASPSPWSRPRPGAGNEFDELEMDRYTEFHLLSRGLSENSGDLTSTAQEIAATTSDFEGYLTRLKRLLSEAQDKLMRLRMVPLSTLAARLHRSVRVTAREQGKEVELRLDGRETEIDKTVLEALAGPLLHLLRNSVGHGIEPAAERGAAGKSEIGEVWIRASYEGTQVVIEVGDDGTGLDADRLLAAALAGGHLEASEAEALGPEEIHDLIFLPGFSTAEEVSEISGRGVGLDAVKTEVERLKGTLAVASWPGRGVTFTIRLPMTLAVSRVLMVRSGGETLAVPLAEIQQILRVESSALESLGREKMLRLEGRVYPVVHLSEALGLAGSPPGTRLSVLLVRLAEREVALLVDQILEAREVVVKTLGSLLRHVHGVSGATLLGDGSVVLILAPSDLIRERPAARPARAGLRPAPGRSGDERRLDVMIVDDSVSVRRVLANLIRNSGWNPIVARDGLEALQMIQQLPSPPDVMLLDIEMPRMDGYELTSSLRSQPDTRGLPIIMVTSRAGEKHRRKAFELGASEYLVKPYRDEVLTETIRKLERRSRELTVQ